VDSLTTEWNPRRYHDTFMEELRERIEAKRAGKKVEIEPAEDDESKVIDLMQALEESVKGAKGPRRGAAQAPGPGPQVSVTHARPRERLGRRRLRFRGADYESRSQGAVSSILS
jgi:hypothetical protein